MPTCSWDGETWTSGESRESELCFERNKLRKQESTKSPSDHVDACAGKLQESAKERFCYIKNKDNYKILLIHCHSLRRVKTQAKPEASDNCKC